MQPQYPAPQQQIPLTQDQVEAIRRSNKLKLVWGLICLIVPTVLLILSIVAYAGFAAISGATITSDGAVYSGGDTGRVIVNVILFIIGSFSAMLWLPGIIVGIILLVTRKSLNSAPPMYQ